MTAAARDLVRPPVPVAKRKTERILVASDRADDAAEVCDGLSAAFDGVESSARSDQAAADFARCRPQVVVLAFRALDKAEDYRQSVLGRADASARPRTVLLCRRESASTAFGLCRRHLFDDYVPYWPQPADDANRLMMSVHIASRRASAATARPSVMVVEDDPFAATLIATMLENEPWTLLFAADAAQALALLEQAQPTVILMDVNLPDLDGLDLTQRLKSMPALADIPVLTLTGEARRETLLRSHSVGAAGFIVKPFTRDALLAKITPFMR